MIRTVDVVVRGGDAPGVTCTGVQSALSYADSTSTDNLGLGDRADWDSLWTRAGSFCHV